MFIKKIIAVALALVAASASAKGSSHVEADVVFLPVPIKPCIVQVTSVHWANANTFSTVTHRTAKYIGETKSHVVIWTFGKEYVLLNTDEPQLEIQRFIDRIKDQCK